LCATGARSNPSLLGCSQRNEKSCLIILVSDEVARLRGYTTGLMLRHERGHCNGWGGDHIGGRPVQSDSYWAPPYERTKLPHEWEVEALRIKGKNLP
jgi:hypothetical protein